MKIRCLVVLVVFVFFTMALTQFCIPQLPLAYAQEEDEEDEEPMQARPNPMQNYIKGAADKTSMQKGTLRRGASRGSKTAATQAVSYEGVDGESMPVDPYDTQVEADSTTSASSVSTEEGVGSVSWDPTDSPASWDPFDKEVNLDSAQMQQQ